MKDLLMLMFYNKLLRLFIGIKKCLCKLDHINRRAYGYIAPRACAFAMEYKKKVNDE